MEARSKFSFSMEGHSSTCFSCWRFVSLTAASPPNRLICELWRSCVALCAVERRMSIDSKSWWRLGCSESNAPGHDEMLHLPAVDDGGVHPRGEIVDVPERAVGVALGDDGLHRRRADVLDGGERIAHDDLPSPFGGGLEWGLALHGVSPSPPPTLPPSGGGDWDSPVKNAPDLLMSGGSTAIPNLRASPANCASLSVEPIS